MVDRALDVHFTPVTPGDFRAAMSHLAAAVSVLTVSHGQRALGVTISSLVSLSLEPPLVLFALHRNSSMLGHLGEGLLGITVLNQDQREVAATLAARGRAPIPATWLHASSGHDEAPTIRNGAMRLTAALVRQWIAGDHVVSVGRVLAIAATNAAPLLYHRRGYVALCTPAPADHP